MEDRNHSLLHEGLGLWLLGVDDGDAITTRRGITVGRAAASRQLPHLVGRDGIGKGLLCRVVTVLSFMILGTGYQRF